MLAGVLLLTLIFQLAITRAPDLPPGGVVPTVAQPQMAEAGAVGIPPLLLQRPIFTPANLASRPGGPTTAPLPLDGAVATGSFSVGGRTTLVVQASDGKTTRLRPGNGYHGWMLTAITPTGAKFRRGAETVTLAYGAAAAAAPRDDSSEDTTQ